MISTLLHLLRLFPFLCGGPRQLALENLALRHQLAVYKRTASRPRLHRSDRLFWALLSRGWTGWRDTLVIVAPETVLRWQRRRFRVSGRPSGGRPPVSAEIQALVTRLAAANPLWGAPRIHGELLKLGLDVAERTVSRLIPQRRTPPSQTWRALLTNHVRDLPLAGRSAWRLARRARVYRVDRSESCRRLLTAPLSPPRAIDADLETDPQFPCDAHDAPLVPRDLDAAAAPSPPVTGLTPCPFFSPEPDPQLKA
jgi:hypothetical protein